MVLTHFALIFFLMLKCSQKRYVTHAIITNCLCANDEFSLAMDIEFKAMSIYFFMNAFMYDVSRQKNLSSNHLDILFIVSLVEKHIISPINLLLF